MYKLLFFMIFLPLEITSQSKYSHISALYDQSEWQNRRETKRNYAHIRSKRKQKLPPCNEDKLMTYLAEIQAINPESIVNLSTLDELDVLCSQVSDQLDAVEEFLSKCEPVDSKDLYHQLIKGVDGLYQMVCNDEAFKTEFQKHFQCIKDLRGDYEDCTGPADWNEDPDQAKVCKAYESIINCYYTKTANVCGKEAAGLMRDLSKAVISSVLIHDCKNFMKNVPKAKGKNHGVLHQGASHEHKLPMIDSKEVYTTPSIYIFLLTVLILIM